MEFWIFLKTDMLKLAQTNGSKEKEQMHVLNVAYAKLNVHKKLKYVNSLRKVIRHYPFKSTENTTFDVEAVEYGGTNIEP